MEKRTVSTVRGRGRGKDVVVGVTSDGVKILRPVVKPTHFTPAQLREAVRQMRAAIAAANENPTSDNDPLTSAD